MNSASQKTIVTKDGIKLYYETSITDAKQTPLFLIHGVGGDLDAWNFLKEKLLAQGFSVITMDIRGHGKSDHPRSFKSYELYHFTEDMLAILDAEKIEKVILVGHSLGAVLVTQIALHYQERIEKLILISSSYVPPPYFKIPGIFLVFNILALLSLPPLNPRHSLYPVGKHHEDVEMYGLIRTIFRHSLKSYILSSKEILKNNIGPLLKNITVPTLIISGNKDSIFPTHLSEYIHTEIKNSSLKIVDGGNHVIILNNVDTVFSYMFGFLQK